MTMRVLPLVAALSSLAAVPSDASPAGTPTRAEVPIREVLLPDGVRRYAVSLTIDGQPVEAQLDTGSTGLRVLARGLPARGALARGPSVRYSYGSGVELRGAKIDAAITIGSVVGTVGIERVDTVDCTDRKPDCPASRLTAAQYAIGGDGLAGQGFDAIIGTGLHADTVANPLLALGVRRWIVELPTARHAGRLVMNPTDEEIATYREFAVLGDSNQVAACLVRIIDRKRICGPAMIDSGASGLRVQGASAADLWTNGTPAAIALGDGNSVADFPIVIGRRDQASGMFAEPYRPGSNQITINLGLAPFFHWSVLFDAATRRIGVADR